MTDLQRYFQSIVKCLLIKVSVSLGPDEGVRFAQRAPVSFKRSSRRRCFSSQ